MDDLIVLWQSRPQLSLRRFAQYASVPYWRLRDYQHSALARCTKQQHNGALYEKVRQAALQHPTSGYRMLYQELKSQGEQIGLHKIRVALGDLNLHPPLPRKTRKPSVKVSAPQDWPEGRRVQIDATRLSLPDGVCWIYSRNVSWTLAIDRGSGMPLPLSDLSMTLLPKWFTGVLEGFAPLFSARIWPKVQLLVVGAIVSPGKRTVTAALRVLGLADNPRFGTFHRLLSRARWSSLQACRVLLNLLLTAFVPSAPLVLGLDDTIERRTGKKISARGIYRDPVRSSHRPK